MLAGPLGALYKPFPPHSGPCKLLRTRSWAQWGDSAPRTTVVQCGPPSKELANTRRGKPSNRAKMETGWEPGPSNQEGGDISSGGKGARGKNKGEEQTGGWRDRGGGVQSGGQSASPAHTSAGSWLGCENSSNLFQPIYALARPLPDTCEAAQKCAPA